MYIFEGTQFFFVKLQFSFFLTVNLFLEDIQLNFSSPKIACKMKGYQNNKYYLTKSAGLCRGIAIFQIFRRHWVSLTRQHRHCYSGPTSQLPGIILATNSSQLTEQIDQNFDLKRPKLSHFQI